MRIDEKEFISPNEALEIAASKGVSVTLMTLHAWARKHELGHQPAGPDTKWIINREKFIAFLEGRCHEN